jgi:hypothetical protein
VNESELSRRLLALLKREGTPCKSDGRDFDESDETNIHVLAALIGETLDALRLAAQQPA